MGPQVGPNHWCAWSYAWKDHAHHMHKNTTLYAYNTSTHLIQGDDNGITNLIRSFVHFITLNGMIQNLTSPCWNPMKQLLAIF